MKKILILFIALISLASCAKQFENKDKCRPEIAYRGKDTMAIWSYDSHNRIKKIKYVADGGEMKFSDYDTLGRPTEITGKMSKKEPLLKRVIEYRNKFQTVNYYDEKDNLVAKDTTYLDNKDIKKYVYYEKDKKGKFTLQLLMDIMQKDKDGSVLQSVAYGYDKQGAIQTQITTDYKYYDADNILFKYYAVDNNYSLNKRLIKTMDVEMLGHEKGRYFELYSYQMANDKVPVKMYYRNSKGLADTIRIKYIKSK
jgi:hypothetical protein